MNDEKSEEIFNENGLKEIIEDEAKQEILNMQKQYGNDNYKEDMLFLGKVDERDEPIRYYNFL